MPSRFDIPIEPLRKNFGPIDRIPSNFRPIKARIKWRAWLVSEPVAALEVSADLATKQESEN